MLSPGKPTGRDTVTDAYRLAHHQSQPNRYSLSSHEPTVDDHVPVPGKSRERCDMPATRRILPASIALTVAVGTGLLTDLAPPAAAVTCNGGPCGSPRRRWRGHF